MEQIIFQNKKQNDTLDNDDNDDDDLQKQNSSINLDIEGHRNFENFRNLINMLSEKYESN